MAEWSVVEATTEYINGHFYMREKDAVRFVTPEAVTNYLSRVEYPGKHCVSVWPVRYGRDRITEQMMGDAWLAEHSEVAA